MYNERDSLDCRHKKTLNGLTCRSNQSIIQSNMYNPNNFYKNLTFFKNKDTGFYY